LRKHATVDLLSAMPIRPLIPTLVVLFLLALASSASAEVAKFRASLTGTYTQQGTVTDTRCWRTDDNDNTVYFTSQGTASENDSFKSGKSISLTVSRTRGQKTFDAGSLSHLQTAFTLNRTSTLAGQDTPPNCHPNDQFGAPANDCGTKQKTYGLRIYGRTDKAAFSYLFTKGFTTYYPDDPFTGCSLAGGGLWPGQLQTSGPGAVSPGKLFNRRLKTIVVHGGNSGTTHGDSGTDSRGTYKLSWTLTLKRR
jgi:hypothetical protein